MFIEIASNQPPFSTSVLKSRMPHVISVSASQNIPPGSSSLPLPVLKHSQKALM